MNLEGADQSLVAAAHELKTPLVLMRQLSYELESCDDVTRRNETIRRMRLTAERSLRLADNLTKMARLEDAMFTMEPIQISGLCHEVIDELSPLSRALQQTFTVNVSGKSTVAVGNRDLLRSLLMGLIDNALQYNSASPIQISVNARRGETVIAVRDHGPIMDLHEYRRLAKSLGSHTMPISARPLSSGLGLMIAGRFAAAMYGRLTVSRHHSGGMTFRTHLPTSSQMSFADLVGESRAGV
jgi:K+-sensing histidine kinase KdpD